MSQVIIFGASNTAGHWDEVGGWTVRLKQKVNQMVVASNFALYHDFYDLSVSGDTSRDVLSKFKQELKPRLDQTEETIIILDFGTNDSAFNNQTKENQVPLPEFANNLKTVITQARQATDKIIFVGPSPVDETKVNPIPWFPPYSYLNQEVKKFGEVANKIATTEKLVFVDIFDKMINHQKDYLTADGVHLNTAGHKYIFEKVWPILEQFLKETNG